MINPFKVFWHWWNRDKVMRNSEIQVYASRTTTFPLEKCTAENLLTAARFDRRKARLHTKKRHKQHKRANAEWYELAADALESLARLLEDGQTVEDIPYRKRKKQMEMLLRISTGKAA